MSIDEEVIAALDMVYAPPEVPQDVPLGNVRRGPWRKRYGMVAGIAAVLVLILAYPAVTAISTVISTVISPGSHRQSSRTDAEPAPRATAAVMSLASLRPVTVDAAHTPRIRAAVLDGHPVTAWVASIGRSGKYVYDLGNARLTEFTAVLPASDSGLTDPCSWRLQLGDGAPQTYQTQPAANVPMTLSGSGAMTITVAPAHPGDSAANCAMTDPVYQPGQSSTVASSAPEPVASQGLASPPVTPSQPSQQPSQQATQQQAIASASAGSAAPSPSASSPASPSATATTASAQGGTPAPSAAPTPAGPAAGPTEPAIQPEGGD
jgi:hypothetical protein